MPENLSIHNELRDGLSTLKANQKETYRRLESIEKKQDEQAKETNKILVEVGKIMTKQARSGTIAGVISGGIMAWIVEKFK